MENVGFEPSTVHGTIHGPGYSGAGGIERRDSTPCRRRPGLRGRLPHPSPSTGRLTSITWSVDGNVWASGAPRPTWAGSSGVFNRPYFLILNLAVGGYWPGDPTAPPSSRSHWSMDVSVTTTSDSSTGGAISGLGGKCVDVAAANSANGTPVQLYDCNGIFASGPAVDGGLRRHDPGKLGKCLDVNAGGTADGTVVQLWDCNGSVAQRWVVTAASATSSIRRPTSASTPPATARPTAPACRSGPARAALHRQEVDGSG